MQFDSRLAHVRRSDTATLMFTVDDWKVIVAALSRDLRREHPDIRVRRIREAIVPVTAPLETPEEVMARDETEAA